MPGPSNSRKKRKSQGKNRHQRKSSSGSSPSIILLSLKDVKDAPEAGFHGEEQGEERRRSVASDLSVDTTGLRTPGSPVVSGPQDGGSAAFGKAQAVGEVEASTIIFPDYATDDSSTTHEETPCLKVEQLVSMPASEWQQLPEGLPTYAPGKHDDILLKEPCIHDSGNGPRVRNTREFLASRFFAHPPALEDPLRAEFSQVEVLQMLKTVLPEEMALILWYNKSRATSRICPACHRLYLVGDVLSDAIDLIEENPISDNPPTPSSGIHPQLRREQDLSGLCSSICFILASVAQCDPLSIKATWGHTADEIDDKSWSQISQSPDDIKSSNFRELTMVLRMTRLHDLGLRQLCFPDLDLDKPTCDDYGEEVSE
ncbi:hypothetical protein E1B28_013576 [Marasmius oreades]|uniref:Uncharacterized protein n=1 Tax=Marasmius oreades TaxID=181124 RepID=A0A9P7RRA9_9AGAR|nr:uncharacterized protein E1B28_013576 [Marasmius oreades]KAG7087628.1 hypothetical protein E1B28_013576 [Marasmius oreades]